MGSIALSIEGPTDRAAAETILASRSLTVDPLNVYEKAGKGRLDPKIPGYNAAARHRPWLVLRDADHDCDGCPAKLRRRLLPPDSHTPGLCLRLPVRALEAWLLADTDAFADFFAVAMSRVPTMVEDIADPKRTLVEVCRQSRKRLIRQAMAPPAKSSGRVGPEYATFLIDYCRSAWRPDVAAGNAPSLARALRDIDRLIADGVWT